MTRSLLRPFRLRLRPFRLRPHPRQPPLHPVVLTVLCLPLVLAACSSGPAFLSPPPPLADRTPPGELRQAPRYELPPEMAPEEVFGPGFDRDGNPIAAEAGTRRPRPALDGGFPRLSDVPPRPDDLPTPEHREDIRRALETGGPMPPEPVPGGERSRSIAPNAGQTVVPIGPQPQSQPRPLQRSQAPARSAAPAAAADRPQLAEAAALDPMRQRVADRFAASGATSGHAVAAPAPTAAFAEEATIDPMRQRFLERFAASGRSTTAAPGEARAAAADPPPFMPTGAAAPRDTPAAAPAARTAAPTATAPRGLAPSQPPAATPALPVLVTAPEEPPIPESTARTVQGLGRIAFAAGQAGLDDAALTALTEIAADLPRDGRIYLVGLADAGETGDPQALARSRTEIVRVALTARGVPPGRMATSIASPARGGTAVEIRLES